MRTLWQWQGTLWRWGAAVWLCLPVLHGAIMQPESHHCSAALSAFMELLCGHMMLTALLCGGEAHGAARGNTTSCGGIDSSQEDF